MSSFQGSSEFSANYNNNPIGAHTLELRPSVGRFQTPSSLSFTGSAYSASSAQPGQIMRGNLSDHAQCRNNLAQAQSLNREQGNLQRYYGNGTAQLFNPAPTKNGYSK